MSRKDLLKMQYRVQNSGPHRRRFDVIVVGAGASGMTAAIRLARGGLSTAVLEAGGMAGKKLLATGNGKCNFTNSTQTPDCYRGGRPQAAMELLGRYGVDKVLSFLEEIGIYPVQKNGYWYPNSGQAASVRESLEQELLRSGAKLYLGCRAREILGGGEDFGSTRFEVLAQMDQEPGQKETGKGQAAQEGGSEVRFGADYVILACGGLAGATNPACGSGYQLAQALGLSIVMPVPALVQLKAKEDVCRRLCGVRMMAEGKLVLPDGTYREYGEFLFTDYGISGIPAMQLSRFASVLLNREMSGFRTSCDDTGRKEKSVRGVPFFLDFFPDKEEHKLAKMLRERFAHFPDRDIAGVLLGLLPAKMNAVLASMVSVPAKKGRGRAGNPAMAEELAHWIKQFPLTICGTKTFESAQVTAGGVSMEELVPYTMETKHIRGLYVVGELADLDGTCGGYNLQWAWMSGMAASDNILKQYRGKDGGMRERGQV